jgi:hypothetical protein
MITVGDVPNICVERAAIEYGVPVALLSAIGRHEGGRAGLVNTKNKNGSSDYGAFQINSYWVKDLSKAWRLTDDQVISVLTWNNCQNVRMGAWILRVCLERGIKKFGSISDATNFYASVSCYATGRVEYYHDYVSSIRRLMAGQKR